MAGNRRSVAKGTKPAAVAAGGRSTVNPPAKRGAKRGRTSVVEREPSPSEHGTDSGSSDDEDFEDDPDEEEDESKEEDDDDEGGEEEETKINKTVFRQNKRSRTEAAADAVRHGALTARR